MLVGVKAGLVFLVKSALYSKGCIFKSHFYACTVIHALRQWNYLMYRSRLECGDSNIK